MTMTCICVRVRMLQLPVKKTSKFDFIMVLLDLMHARRTYDH